MDIEYLLVLQQFREGPGQFLRDFLLQMTDLTDKSTDIVIVAIIYWCVSKKYGSWLWLGWSANRLVNGFLKVTACVYRPWIRSSEIIPDAEAKLDATGYSFPSGHSTNAASLFGSGILYKGFKLGQRILFAVLSALVLFSRNYLSVHTPQDVLVGFFTGLLIMYLVSRLMEWLEKHPEKEPVFTVCGIVLAAAVGIYAGVKSYPVDYDADGKILVDGAKMAKDTFKASGWCLAVLTGRILEKRYVGFSTDVSLNDKIFRLTAGLIGFYVINDIICTVIKNLITNPLGTVISSFLPVFYIVFLAPLLFVKLEKETVKTKTPA